MFFCSNHGTYSVVVESCVSRCVGAPKVSFMLALLALIGLQKIRSFQKPRRIASSSSSFLPLALPPPRARCYCPTESVCHFGAMCLSSLTLSFLSSPLPCSSSPSLSPCSSSLSSRSTSDRKRPSLPHHHICSKTVGKLLEMEILSKTVGKLLEKTFLEMRSRTVGKLWKNLGNRREARKAGGTGLFRSKVNL